MKKKSKSYIAKTLKRARSVITREVKMNAKQSA
jgi:IS30 family transposase